MSLSSAYVVSVGRDRHRYTAKRAAIRAAHRFARWRLKRRISVRAHGELIYQCHAHVVRGHVRLVTEEL